MFDAAINNLTTFGIVLAVVFVAVIIRIVLSALGWWREPSPVAAVDLVEVASVHRVAIADLVDPANRCRVRHPSGYVGFGFEVHDLLVWGFTAGLLNGILELAAWSRPWDDARVVDLPPVGPAGPSAKPPDLAGWIDRP